MRVRPHAMFAKTATKAGAQLWTAPTSPSQRVSGGMTPWTHSAEVNTELDGGRPRVLAWRARRWRIHRDPAVEPSIRRWASPYMKRRSSVRPRRGISPAGGRAGVPLSSVLLAAHAKVLSALSAERDVVTGYVAGKAVALPAG